MSAPFFSSNKRASNPQNAIEQEVRLHIFTGLAIVLGLIGVIVLVLYIVVLPKSRVAFGLSLAGLALLGIFLSWKFFRDNGAMITGRLFSSSSSS